MRYVLLFGLCLGLVAVLSAGFQGVDPALLVNLPGDLAALPELQDKLRCENERREQLEQRREKMTEQFQERDRVAAELAAGRMTLAEAAARFKELLMSYRVSRDYLRHYGVRPGAEERLYRQVILWTQDFLVREPAKAAEVTARLEKELADHLQHISRESH
jgi:hypothetical protein